MADFPTTVLWPTGNSAIRRRLRDLDWSATRLGPQVGWPDHLRTILDLMLAHDFPMAVLWGPDHLLLFNDAYTELIGKAGEDGLGRPLHETWPHLRTLNEPVLAKVQRGVAVSLRDQRYPDVRQGTGPYAWFDLSLSPLPGPSGTVDGILVTAFETTRRVLADRELRDQQERQSYLLRLTDALRLLADPQAVKHEATRLLGLQLRPSRVAYGEVQHDDRHIVFGPNQLQDGAPEVTGRFKMADFCGSLLGALAAGRTVVLDDVATAAELTAAERSAYASLGIRALIGVPLVKGGRFVAILAMHQMTPRAWTTAEIGLVEETAERTWAAVARAKAEESLAASEELFRSFAENAAHVLWISPADHSGLEYLSPSFDRVFGEDRQRVLHDLASWRNLVWPDDLPIAAAASQSLLGGKPTSAEYRIVRPTDGAVRHIRDTGFPVLNAQRQITRLAGIAADVTDQRRAEAALRASEEQYRVLFESIDEGFCLIDMIFDADSQPTDYRFVEANSAFELHAGLRDVAGRTALDLVPDLERWWIDTYGRVALSGRPERFQHRSAAMGRWFEVYAARVGGAGSARVAVIFNDITDRRQAEEMLRSNEARQSSLLRLTDALRPLTDPAAIPANAMQVLGAHFAGSDACYWEADADTGFAAAGSTSDRPADWAPETLAALQNGRTLILSDLDVIPGRDAGLPHTIAEPAIRSRVIVPVVKGGRLAAILGLFDPTPRDWSEPDIALVQEVAERTWAAMDRARSADNLRENQERLRASVALFRQFAEASTDVLWIRAADTLHSDYLSPAFGTVYGIGPETLPGQTDYQAWVDLIHPDDRDATVASIHRVRSGARVTHEFRVCRVSDGETRWVRDTVFPLFDAAGQVERIGGIGQDITKLKRAEAEAAESARRFRSLAEGIPQLVWRAAPDGLWTWASPQWSVHTGQGDKDSLGWGWLTSVHPEDRDLARHAWAGARSAGHFQASYRIRDAQTGTYRWFQTRAVPVHAADGTVTEWLGTSTDVQDLRAMQERLNVLVAELQHRTRNLMAVISVVMDRTLASTDTLEDFRAQIRSRLGAISRASSLLSRLEWDERITFDELLRTELLGHGIEAAGSPDQITLDGPKDVRLRSSTLQTLALALHELTTNALKYGALSVPQGRLSVRWAVQTSDGGDRMLHVDWSETSPGARTPKNMGGDSDGFGRELIERALPYQFNALTSYRLSPEGLECSISLPIAPG